MTQHRRAWPARIKHGRYLLFLALLILLPWPLTSLLPPVEAALAAFDLAALVFIASVIPLWRDGAPGIIRRQAERDDGGQVTLLVLTAILLVAIMSAITTLLTGKNVLGAPLLAMLVASLLIAWFFSNLVFAFHYAKLYYSRTGLGKDLGGLDFPGEEEPVFADFVNFSFVLGMTCQTADIAITDQKMRRVATGHGLLAFVFNLVVLAMTVNILAGAA
ncbi:MAG TPA: DUF1345 domain-containing protein [Novosphingobium sp.]